MAASGSHTAQTSSLPSRERGLKSGRGQGGRRGQRVAPFTGAWIEISSRTHARGVSPVAPFTEAWIEMMKATALSANPWRRSLHGSVD